MVWSGKRCACGNAYGTLAMTGHTLASGSALTHKWITTDFAEALLEFITPVDGDIEHMLTFMRDVHRYTARQLGATSGCGR